MVAGENGSDDTPLDILAALSHEIRTPIHSLSATLDFLSEDFDELSRDQAHEMLARLRRNTTWLGTLADNLVRARGADRGSATLQLQPLAAWICIDDALAVVRPFLESKNQTARVHAPESCMLWADPVSIGQVLVNLLINASKYSVAGDEIEISATQADGKVMISVTDHGPGIDEADQQQIFRRYVRGTGATAGGGIGLGLNIVRTLVELHGGEVRLDSACGHGSTFTIVLPAHEPTR